jgi:hypothetical protein
VILTTRVQKMTARKTQDETVHADCPEYGAHFRLYRLWQRFCSPKCRDRQKARNMRAAARAFRQQQRQTELTEAK